MLLLGTLARALGEAACHRISTQAFPEKACLCQAGPGQDDVLEVPPGPTLSGVRRDFTPKLMQPMSAHFLGNSRGRVSAPNGLHPESHPHCTRGGLCTGLKRFTSLGSLDS